MNRILGELDSEDCKLIADILHGRIANAGKTNAIGSDDVQRLKELLKLFTKLDNRLDVAASYGIIRLQ